MLPFQAELQHEAFEEFERFGTKVDKDKFQEFVVANSTEWLSFYSKYMAVVDLKVAQGEPRETAEFWQYWQSNEAKKEWILEQAPPTERFHQYIQWVATSQFANLKLFAERHDVHLMGDIPIGAGVIDLLERRDEFYHDRYYGVEPYGKDRRPDDDFRGPNGSWRFPFNASLRNGQPKADEEQLLCGDVPYYNQLDPNGYLANFGQHWDLLARKVEVMEANGFEYDYLRAKASGLLFHIVRFDASDHYERYWSIPWSGSKCDEVNKLFLDQGLSAVEKQYGLPTIEPNCSVSDNRRRAIAIFDRLKQGLEVGSGKAYGAGVRGIAENVGPRTPHFDHMLREVGFGGFALAVLKINDPQFTELSLSGYHAGSIVGFTNHDYPSLETELRTLYSVDSISSRLKLEMYYTLAGLPSGAVLSNTPENRRKIAVGVMCNLVRVADQKGLDVIFTSGDIEGNDIEYNRPGIPSSLEWADKPGCKCWSARDLADSSDQRKNFYDLINWSRSNVRLSEPEFNAALHAEVDSRLACGGGRTMTRSLQP